MWIEKCCALAKDVNAKRCKASAGCILNLSVLLASTHTVISCTRKICKCSTRLSCKYFANSDHCFVFIGIRLYCAINWHNHFVLQFGALCSTCFKIFGPSGHAYVLLVFFNSFTYGIRWLTCIVTSTFCYSWAAVVQVVLCGCISVQVAICTGISVQVAVCTGIFLSL